MKPHQVNRIAALIIFAFFTVHFVAAQQETGKPSISGSEDACEGTSSRYICNPGQGCKFSYWSWSGSAIIPQNSSTTTRTGSIELLWTGGGGMLFANCDCGGSEQHANITVTVQSIALRIQASSTAIETGETITLTASGATNYTWSGPGLSSTTGPIVQATPPAGGHTYGVVGTRINSTTKNVVCSDFKTVAVTATTPLPPLKQATNVTLCRNSTLHYDLANQGISLTDGYWSGPSAGSNIGPKIEASVIDASSFADGEYTFTYTRTDNLTTSFKLTIQSTLAGTITFAPDPLADQCQAGIGTLTSNPDRRGNVQVWERSTDKGISWLPVSSSQGAPSINVSVTSATQYRVAVKNRDCAIDYSPPVTVRPLKPTVGTLAPSSISINCGHATGVLSVRDNYDGDKITWEVQTDGGWQTIAGANADIYTFNVNDNVNYRVKVERTTTNCSPAYSHTYHVSVVSQGGTPTSTRNTACGTSTSDIYLHSFLGSIVHWEYSTDNAQWNKIPNSEGRLPLRHSTAAPISYYRAFVQLRTCPGAYSEPYSITTSDPTVAGAVRFTGEVKDAVMVNGEYVFYPRFELQNHLGAVENWHSNTDVLFGGLDQIINTQEVFLTPEVKTTTAFRAKVKNGACDALLSGSAVFVINPLFVGVIRVLDHQIITTYGGRSYKVANGDGLSIQDGFSFHANSAQEFFVLLDENYNVPTQDVNYELEETVLAEGIEDDGDIYFLNAAEVSTAYNYIDGIGRPIQHVQRKASPDEKDIVKPFAYDGAGRPFKDYLPYAASSSDGFFKETALSDQSAFYLTPSISKKIAGTPYPFAVKIYENSALNRISLQGAPGAEWQPDIGHPLKYEYFVNDAASIKLWDVDANGKPIVIGAYAEGDLKIDVSIDEHGSQIKAFRDKKDRVVLKQVQNKTEFLETCYIYDDFDRLRFVIQPQGNALLNGNPDDSFLDRWSFQYHYDVRHRLIEKKIPGSASVYMIYDERDRLVLSQDGNQRANDQWSFTKFDALNRPIITGIYTHIPADPSRGKTRHDVASLLTPTLNESLSASGPYGYTNDAFPIANTEVHTVVYYDNYDHQSMWTDAASFKYKPEAMEGLPVEASSNTNGFVTGKMVKVLDGNNTFLKTANYYDNRDRSIQVASSNILSGVDRYCIKYDFAGKILAQKTTHTTSSASTQASEEFNYDHSGRLLSHYHQIENGPKILLSQHAYNPLGQLVEKNLHLSPQGFTQSVDYRYNIRGWLTHINNSALTNDDGITNDEANDWFGMELAYQSRIGSGAITPQFNGNISSIKWSSNLGLDIIKERAYNFDYDAMNRLLSATQKERTSVWASSPSYHENNITYDLNGNILSLSRKGPDGSQMDILKYDYGTGASQSNQLLKVEDRGDKTNGFTDGTNEDNDYAYDSNGNMVSDKNKDIASITYNHLNLANKVTKVNGEYIKYIYDAAGIKLSQEVYNASNEAQKRTDYVGTYIYENNVLQFVNQGEGRIVMTGASPEYQYHLKDHLGNVRMTFTTKEEVENDIATLETEHASKEHAKFLNYEEAVIANHEIFDHTSDGTTNSTYNATRLVGGNTDEIYGLARSLSVMPGDEISMEVYAKYLDPDPDNWTGLHEDFLAAYASGTPPAGIIIDGGLPGSIGNGTFPFAQFLIPGPREETAPKAYLNWIVCDRNFKPIISECGFVQVGSTGTLPKENGTNVAHELLKRAEPLKINQPGYVYIYLSNENETSVEVFFDDFKVEHVKSPIVSMQDYYPFGLTFNSYSRENSVSNQYQYNGKEKQDELDLGWLDYGARMYMPEIGRWGVIDRKSEAYTPWSPYNYVLNNPLKYIDPNGEDVYLVMWTTGDGFGHVGIAVDNYKTEKYKVKEKYKDENGKTRTRTVEKERQVKDGTVTYYDFWPGVGVGKGDAQTDVPGLYNKKTTTLSDLMTKDVTGAEGRPADGIIQLKTDVHQDNAVKEELGQFEYDNGMYNGARCNCSDFVDAGIVTAAPHGLSSFNSQEQIGSDRVTTPHQLFQATRGLSNATVIKDPGTQVEKGFVEAITGGGKRQRKAETKKVN